MGSSSRQVEFDPAELVHAPGGGIAAHQPHAPKVLEDFESPRAAEPEKPHNDATRAAPLPKITQAEAAAAVAQAQRALLDRRMTVRRLSNEVAEQRGRVYAATAAFVAGTEGSAEERRLAAVRDFQAGSQATRAARAAAGLSGTSESSKAFLRKQFRGGGNMRGAFPASWKHRTDPRYIPPSDKRG